MQFYCLKCKAKVEVPDPEETLIKGKGGSPRRVKRGNCPTCNTKVFKIVKLKKD